VPLGRQAVEDRAHRVVQAGNTDALQVSLPPVFDVLRNPPELPRRDLLVHGKPVASRRGDGFRRHRVVVARDTASYPQEGRVAFLQQRQASLNGLGRGLRGRERQHRRDRRKRRHHADDQAPHHAATRPRDMSVNRSLRPGRGAPMTEAQLGARQARAPTQSVTD
jgi:hypothetical protein